MKIVSIIGARPQLIKASSISRAIKNHNQSKDRINNEHIIEVILHTGQHFDNNMSDIFFEQMMIPEPDYNLSIHSISHGAMTGQMLEKIEEVLIYEKPDWVIVYGDTNSTLAGALAAKKVHIRVAHVEAGLRSFNMNMPEEINRTLTDRISDVLFCPTDKAVKNLENEGFGSFNCRIVKCGDVMYDAALFYSKYAKKPDILINNPKFNNKKYILATVHREENTDNKERLNNIFDAFNEISKEIPIILPLHPRTKQRLVNLDHNFSPRLYIIEPVGYLEMVYLLKNCTLVITDSGGLQKESYFFNKGCVTIRDETEWTELVTAGVNIIAGTSQENIYYSYKLMLSKEYDFDVRLYGNGYTADLILNKLLS